MQTMRRHKNKQSVPNPRQREAKKLKQQTECRVEVLLNAFTQIDHEVEDLMLVEHIEKSENLVAAANGVESQSQNL